MSADELGRYRATSRLVDAVEVGFDDLEEVLAEVPDRLGYVDPVSDNRVRASFAATGLVAYATRTGTYRNEAVFTALRDLTNDLRHLCDLIGLDWTEVAEPFHYDHEVTWEG